MGLLAGIPRVFIVTTKHILAGAQIFVSYGVPYWEAAKRHGTIRLEL